MSDSPTGPAWNVEDLPSAYNGTPIFWDAENFDTAAMPFVVAIRQNFWSWRVTQFTVGTGYLHVEVDLPSAMPDGLSLISFETGDVTPETAHTEFAELLKVMGSVLLDAPWSYRLRLTDGERSSEFSGRFGPAAGA